MIKNYVGFVISDDQGWSIFRKNAKVQDATTVKKKF